MAAKIHCNPTIVVKLIKGANNRFAILDVAPGTRVTVKGAGFQPGEILVITICEEDKVLIRRVVANKCGAFIANTTIPALTPDVYSLKALNGEVVRAAWPLDIIKKEKE
jgi:hypothetical protein